jgi:hypothetical protein
MLLILFIVALNCRRRQGETALAKLGPDRVRGNRSCLVAKGLVIVKRAATPGTLTGTAYA